VLKAKYIEGDPAIGESWEFSAGPELPSFLERPVHGEVRTLDALVESAKALMLGREAARGGTGLLVKLLDAAEPLSVQIHPPDDYEGLACRESGKPESWYIEHAEPGAGLYFGLAKGVTQRSMAKAIANGDDVSALLAFVTVEEGDFFVVDAGTPHAVGAGVTLVEPQRVLPGKHGVTYRYWDWNRRYDAAGRPSRDGVPRVLHTEHALAVTDWSRPRGAAFLEKARYRAGRAEVSRAPRIERLSGPENAALFSNALEVLRLSGHGRCVLPRADALRSITVLTGAIELGGLRIECGRTAAIPAACLDLLCECEHACAILAAAC
jgi:mannose-6-phosphate isomerase